MRKQYILCSEAAPLIMATVSDGLPPCLQPRTFPVEPGTKKPAVKKWQKSLKTRHGQEEQMRRYIRDFPNSTVGIRLGWDYATNSNLAVIDIDKPDALTEHQLNVLEKWPWLVRTRRGIHCYGLLPHGVVMEKNYAWGEFLSEGAFVMAPGTLHPTGIQYRPSPHFGKGNIPTFSPELLEDLAKATRPSDPPCPAPPHTPTIGKPDTFGGAWTGSPNPALFEMLRHWAYKQPRPATQEEWRQTIVTKGLEMAAAMPDRSGINDQAVIGMAGRIASWTWKYRRPANPFSTTDSEVQKERNRRSIASRRARVAERNERVLELHAKGWSVRSIASTMQIGKSTVGDVVKIAKLGGITATLEESS